MMTTVTNERPSGTELLALYDAVGWTAYTRYPDALAAMRPVSPSRSSCWQRCVRP